MVFDSAYIVDLEMKRDRLIEDIYDLKEEIAGDYQFFPSDLHEAELDLVEWKGELELLEAKILMAETGQDTALPPGVASLQARREMLKAKK